MSISVLLSPAPGWYPDPAGIAEFRWWDGDTWTEGTHAGAPTAVADVEPARTPPIRIFADPAPSFDSFDLTPIVHAPLPEISETSETIPSGPAAPRGPAPRARSSPAKTRWSSMLLAFPFVYPLVVGMAVALGYAGGAASSIPALIVIAVVAGIGGLIPAWVFADHDRRELVARGYEPAPSIAWMLLLPPVAYLLARRRVVGPSY